MFSIQQRRQAVDDSQDLQQRLGNYRYSHDKHEQEDPLVDGQHSVPQVGTIVNERGNFAFATKHHVEAPACGRWHHPKLQNKLQYNWAPVKYREGNLLNLYQIDQKVAMGFPRIAWRQVIGTTIANCFRHTELFGEASDINPIDE
ncbi:uncharacterized protein BYT42DRAFT_102432 [Radiomyces spectabilis]|uniref:uncharacterized protein n=1 Tax=Radiomyces spectabilis TaxID=64574 RepID=UPI002220EB6D|nr:uncharacterized protein BYT42DRAFT_102432 [Radiomyces spectabilis]KAI8369260.1 hypothetical protein BYT42DRAFT_102432 [Radiomyces spectabilis]